jgi:ferredoxin-type protein NapF
VDSSRRNFLRARVKPATAPFRPPWAGSEAEFIEQCNRCGECILACARSGNGLLQFGDGSYPVAVFNPASCSLCGDCLSACTRSGSIALSAERPRWQLTIAINDSCLTRQQVVCRTCGEHCDAGALRFTPQLGSVAVPQLDTDRCSGCGDCLANCPTQAIAMVRRPAPEPLSTPSSMQQQPPREAL